MSELAGDARQLSPSAQEALRLRAVAALVAGQLWTRAGMGDLIAKPYRCG
ncbi:hypothetical protein [Streptomyces sp. HC307]